MKLSAIPLLCLVFIGGFARGDIDADIESLSKTFDGVVATIKHAPEAEQPRLYDKLREQVGGMMSVVGSVPDGDDKLKTERSNGILAHFVYVAFLADQGHLERTVMHAKDKDAAIAEMPSRAKCLMGMFPVCPASAVGEGRPPSAALQERIFFVQYLGHAHRYIPEALASLVRAQMPRWSGEDRIPGLLVLVKSGDEKAKSELAGFDSKPSRTLKSIFRSITDSAKEPEAPKGLFENPVLKKFKQLKGSQP